MVIPTLQAGTPSLSFRPMRSRRLYRRPKRARVTFAHYFIPGVHNAYTPHFLRGNSLITLAAAVIILFLLALGVERLVIQSPSPQTAAVIASVLVDLANRDREAHGVRKLAVSPILRKAAQMKADDMAAKGYFAHNSPDGKTPWSWFDKAGYSFAFAGENLAVYFSDSSEVEKAWMNSPLHRANILNSHFTEVGIALAHGIYDGRDTVFVVQMFGTPVAGERAFAVVEENVAPAAESTVLGATVEARPLDVIVEDETFIAVRNTTSAAAAASQGEAAAKDSSSILWRLLTSPKTTLQYIYSAIAIIVTLALVLFVVVEIRRQSWLHIILVLVLLALIAFLLYIGTPFFADTVLVA